MRNILTDEERRGAENMAVRFIGYSVDVALVRQVSRNAVPGHVLLNAVPKQPRNSVQKYTQA